MPASLRITRRDLLRSAVACASCSTASRLAHAATLAQEFPLPWQKASLANGARLFVAPTDSKYVSAAVRVRYSEINERADEDGIAHFLEHVMGKGGAGPYDHPIANEMRSAFPEENAETTLEHVSFSAEFNPDQLPSFLDITGHSLFEPRLEHRIIEQERKRVVEELSEWGNSRAFRDMQKFDKALYGEKHPLSTFYPDKEIKTVRSVTRADLQAFHKRFACANLADVFLVGGLPDTVVDLTNRTIGAFRTPLGHADPMRPVSLLTRRTIIGPLKAPDLMKGRTQFKIGWNTEALFGHKDMGALIIALKHLDAMLAKTVSDTLGMVYGLGLTFKPTKTSASIVIEGSTQAESRQIIDAVQSVLDNVRRAPMSDKELQHIKSRLRFLASTRMQDNREVLKRLQRYADFGKSYYEAGIGSVTAKQALAAASRHLPETSGNFVVILRKAA